MHEAQNILTSSEMETIGAAALFARKLVPGAVIAMYGDLGAGKTVFARGVARGLGIDDEITSPTFTLIHEYRGRLPFYHMDLYRLKNEEEILAIGIEDYLYGEGVCLIEWAEKLGGLLPDDAIRISIHHADETSREIRIGESGDDR